MRHRKLNIVDMLRFMITFIMVSITLSSFLYDTKLDMVNLEIAYIISAATLIIVIIWRIYDRVVVNNMNNVATDIIAFKRSGSNKSKFYVSLNDSWTEYVLTEQNGMLYKRFKLKRNTENNERLVEDLYEGGE